MENSMEDGAQVKVPEYARRLIAARRERDLDQRSLATSLRIRLLYIDALENGRPEELPSGAYALGFARSYARFVGLDPDEIARLFREYVGKDSQSGNLHMRQEEEAPRSPGTNRLMIAFLGLAVAAAVGLGVSFFLGDGDGMSGGSAVTEAESGSESGDEAGRVVTVEIPIEGDAASRENEFIAPAQGMIGALPAGSVIITATENSWIEISDDAGAVIMTRVFQPGENYVVPRRDGLSLATGNARGLILHFGPGESRRLAADGDQLVVRRVPLSAPELREYFGSAAGAGAR